MYVKRLRDIYAYRVWKDFIFARAVVNFRVTGARPMATNLVTQVDVSNTTAVMGPSRMGVYLLVGTHVPIQLMLRRKVLLARIPDTERGNTALAQIPSNAVANGRLCVQARSFNTILILFLEGSQVTSLCAARGIPPAANGRTSWSQS